MQFFTPHAHSLQKVKLSSPLQSFPTFAKITSKQKFLMLNFLNTLTTHLLFVMTANYTYFFETDKSDAELQYSQAVEFFEAIKHYLLLGNYLQCSEF